MESIAVPLNSSLHTSDHVVDDDALLAMLDCEDVELDKLDEFNKTEDVVDDAEEVVNELLITELLELVATEELLFDLPLPPPQAIRVRAIVFIKINFFIYGSPLFFITLLFSGTINSYPNYFLKLY